MSTAKAHIQKYLGKPLSQETDKNQLKRLAAQLKRKGLPYKAVLKHSRAVTKARGVYGGRAARSKTVGRYRTAVSKLGAAGGPGTFHGLLASGRPRGALARGTVLRRKAKVQGGRVLGVRKGGKYTKGRVTSTQYMDRNYDRIIGRNPYRPGTKAHAKEAGMIKKAQRRHSKLQQQEAAVIGKSFVSRGQAGRRTVGRAARRARLDKLEAAGKIEKKTITRGGKTFTVRARKAQHSNLDHASFIRKMVRARNMHPRVIANAVHKRGRGEFSQAGAIKLVEEVTGQRMPPKLTAAQKLKRTKQRSLDTAVRGANRKCKKPRTLTTVTRRNPATGKPFSYKACVLPKKARKPRVSYAKVTLAQLNTMSLKELKAMKKAAPKTYAKIQAKAAVRKSKKTVGKSATGKGKHTRFA